MIGEERRPGAGDHSTHSTIEMTALDLSRALRARIANQVKAETVVDRPALDQGIFQDHGGFARLNRILDGQVETILGDFHARIWQDGA